MYHWYLEGHVDHAGPMRKIRVEPLPFLMGRHPGLGLTIESSSISRHHAQISQRDGQLTLKDLNSTNGTFINRKPVKGEVALKEGDILHIANIELRLSCEPMNRVLEDTSTHLDLGGSATNLPVGWVELEELLTGAKVTSDFQTIYDSKDESPFAFEILGRGAHPKLPRSPAALIKIAEGAGCELALVELLRFDGVMRADASKSPLEFFINIHPRELDDPARLLNSIQRVREKFPKPKLILEVHEQAVTNLKVIKMLREELTDLEVGMAYDDFGAGQTRLLELAEMPPDYLKFDIALIKNIDRAAARKEMVELLVRLSKRMHIKTLAEGVSNAEEAAACRALGFDYLQGFHYGQPTPEPK
ncbi:MAG: EAL domain-containing protein [Nitrospiria bacterium]